MKAKGFSRARARLECAMAAGFYLCVWGSVSCLSVLAMATSASSNGGRVVPKTVFSTKMRLVFGLGLEGSGHHYMIGAREAIIRAHKGLPKNVQGPGKGSFYLPDTMRRSAAGFDRARTSARADMRRLARRAELMSSPGTFQFLELYSFPTDNGGQKVMQYVDPRLMAEAAEAEGVDFRVIYMKRSARELLLANTAHRHFENSLSKSGGSSPEFRFMEYVRILFTEVAVVHSFLAELDPAFVICHDWSLLGDPDQAQSIADAVAPTADVASIVRQALVITASRGPMRKANEQHQFDKAEILSSRIQQKLDSFEHLYCDRETH